MKMRQLNIQSSLGTAIALGVMAMTTCSLIAEEAKPLGAERPLIPLPHSYTAKTDAVFKLNSTTTINVVSVTPELEKQAHYLKNLIQPATGYSLAISKSTVTTKANTINLKLEESDEILLPGTYHLEVTKDKILISAQDARGIFYGIQTLRQLLPLEIEATAPQKIDWTIPSCVIKDSPRYQHRGAMLDIARHFFGVKDIKTFIDHIAMYKLNILHLHLSDDQGWRIEIKSWPKLTTIGGSTEVGGGKGGFLTQKEYKEIVKYADDRFVTIIPEIDMPGHVNAALASYPELNPDNKAKKHYTGIRVGFSTLDANNPTTYKFVEDVIREVSAMTTGPYFHIGGDECKKTKRHDYVKFIEKVQEIVEKNDKRMIGWHEIAGVKLSSRTVAQLWKKKAEKHLESKKIPTIQSPADRAYLDMKYSKEFGKTKKLGLHWSGYTNTQKSYDWDPGSSEYILGVEAPLWTETVKTIDDIEMLVFPRIISLSEVAWSAQEKRNWADFSKRLKAFGQRLDTMKINYYKAPEIWEKN